MISLVYHVKPCLIWGYFEHSQLNCSQLAVFMAQISSQVVSWDFVALCAVFLLMSMVIYIHMYVKQSKANGGTQGRQLISKKKS